MSYRVFTEMFYEHPNGPLLRMAQVSPEQMERWKKEHPDLRGVPTYYTVNRKGLKIEIETWPEEAQL